MSHRIGNGWLFTVTGVFFLILVGLFFIGQNLFYDQTVFYFKGNFVILLLYTANLWFTCRTYHGFDFGTADWSQLLLSWILSLLVANTLQYLMLSLIMRRLLPAFGLLWILLAQFLLSVPVTFLIDKLYYRVNPAHIATIIYREEQKAREYYDIVCRLTRRFQIQRIVSDDEPIDTLLDCIDASGSVFFLDVDGERRDRLLEYCYLRDKRPYILPTFTGVLLNSAGLSWISHTPMFVPKISEIAIGTRILKRAIDVAISLIMILFLSWLMVITCAAIFLYDRHSPVYKQVRVTKDGRLFTLYKFRSMHPDAERNGVARLAVRGDERVTPVGKFIRRTRIDELPQLINVLLGTMSLVGPRPERPEIVEQYAKAHPSFLFRTKVKAGLTGMAQIYGRYNTPPQEKLLLDMMYIETISISQDVKLLMQTLRSIFASSSTEGIRTGSVTALDKERAAS